MTQNSQVSLRVDADALAQTLAPVLGGAPVVESVETLAGDASTRCYFRLHFAGASSGISSAIVMQLEKPESGTLDWLEIQDYLKRQRLPVPKVLHYEKDAGLLLIEDLGDQTLETVSATANEEGRNDWYNKAVDLLVDMQANAVVQEGPAFGRKFDVEKLMWEMDFMLRHYLTGFLKRSPAQDVLSRVTKELESVCCFLASLKTCFTHRDFHSRNLMVSGPRLVMIDFQDARLGPPVYDLVSLLRDSYMPLEESFVDDKKQRYLERIGTLEGKTADTDDFHRDFEMMTVQRTLKAIGTFAYQSAELGNRRYEPFIDPAFRSVNRALATRPELAALKNALGEMLPEKFS